MIRALAAGLDYLDLEFLGHPGIIATAVGSHLLIAEPGHQQHGVGLAMVLGGPALYLLGEILFEWRMTRRTNTKRLAVAGAHSCSRRSPVRSRRCCSA